MAMALPPPSRPESAAAYSRTLLADYDISDTRYPSAVYPSDSLPIPSSHATHPTALTPATTGASDVPPESFTSQSRFSASRGNLSASPPREPAHPAVEKRSSDDQPLLASPDSRYRSPPSNFPQDVGPPSPLLSQRQSQLADRPMSFVDSAPRHPNLPGAGMSTMQNGQHSNPIVPLSASPGYSVQISPVPRAQPHQPTYITQTTAPNAVNPVFSPAPPPQEEVCIECAMRDQDMADVDATSPGVWERESDVQFEDLKRAEEEDETNGIPFPEGRVRSKGNRLTEKNLKVWLTLNPRDSSSRQRTLLNYVKSQQSLIEKEALAHAQALQEAKMLDSRMRDAYSQLRRSAYDMGSSAAPADDTGGVRIKPPGAAVAQPHVRSHSRDVTLLENGMIVEHVDVRREEREARDRRRKEERRVRKSSRGSTYDVTSIISSQSYAPQTDSGIGLKPYSRYSQASSGRPMSVLTNPMERGELPRAYSQASFSDVHSLSSASPRRSRFFGNLGSGFRSQNSLAPSGFSGSMVDMHLALQNEPGPRYSVLDPSTLRQSQVWAPDSNLPVEIQEQYSPYGSNQQPKKKKKGLAKIWDKVKGSKSSKQDTMSSRETSRTFERQPQDIDQLAPPPPLSYLVRGESNGRHASTPSLPSALSQKASVMNGPGLSPPTPPSSILPSPVSSRPSVHPEITNDAVRLPNEDNELPGEDTIGKRQSRLIYPVTSEPDFRRRLSQAPSGMPTPVPPVPQSPVIQPFSSPAVRDKSLPPLPGGDYPSPDARPRTVYTYDTQVPESPGLGTPQAPFRTTDMRRQSFSGTAARPNMSYTMPAKQMTLDSRRPFHPQYNEFGASRHSLGNLMQGPPRNVSSPVPSKRKSKFGLTSLFGKKHERDTFSDENMVGEHGYGRNSSMGYRSSVVSRKALEDAVSQDPDFVAYRYPSSDQRLDLFR